MSAPPPINAGNAVLENLHKLFDRAGSRKIYAFAGDGATEELRYYRRKGDTFSRGEPIVNPEWTHACVEGDAGWTDLRTGEFCPQGKRTYQE